MRTRQMARRERPWRRDGRGTQLDTLAPRGQGSAAKRKHQNKKSCNVPHSEMTQSLAKEFQISLKTLPFEVQESPCKGLGISG